ncbi:hypothetical protein HPB51_017469 [Rhipicephalus microplus]|uniref:Uncharacterized protein n=1 Tax=Rhipicephalus microplus TaxID=6941 RepID=A0A9J6F4N6_RHIMP|nr:hypothetical protein HPB51_017469 [Rhipicephalus microplus]
MGCSINKFGHVWRTIDCPAGGRQDSPRREPSPASGRTQGELQQAGHRGRLVSRPVTLPADFQETQRDRTSLGELLSRQKNSRLWKKTRSVEKAQTKQEYHAQRAIGHLEDAEQRKRDRRKIFAKTSSKREVIASKAPTTTKRQRARAEFVSSRLSRQAKRIRRKSRSTSRGSQESEGVASSSGSYRTAEEISSDAGSPTPEQVDHTPPTPPVAEVDSAFDRLRSVWHWLSSNDGIRSSAQNED